MTTAAPTFPLPDLAALPPLDHRGRLEACRAALDGVGRDGAAGSTRCW